jgi:hypothetical protein
MRSPAIRLERLAEATVRVSVGVHSPFHSLGRSIQEPVLEDPAFQKTRMDPQELVGGLQIHPNPLLSRRRSRRLTARG